MVLGIAQGVDSHKYQFYPGWDFVHHPWAPLFAPARVWKVYFWNRFTAYYDVLLYPTLSIVVFLVFGLTKQTRNMYKQAFWALVKPCGFAPRVKKDMSVMSFGIPGIKSTGGLDSRPRCVCFR